MEAKSMKVTRDRVSIQEILESEQEVLNMLYEFDDVWPGNFFFLVDQPDKEYFCEDKGYDKERNEHYIVYDGGKQITWNKCRPIYNFTLMLDMINLYSPVELRTFNHGWSMLICGDEFIESTEEEDLVAFVWRVLKKVTKEREY
jgi:hypothetical protein